MYVILCTESHMRELLEQGFEVAVVSDATHHVRHTEIFGVSVEGVNVDGRAVMRRLRSERDRFVGFVLESVEQYDRRHKLRGFAKQ